MFSKALLIFSLSSVAFATVFVTNPTASTTFSGGKSAQVTWQDSGSAPTLKDFGPAEIGVYVGNALQQTKLQSISNNTDVSLTNTISFTVDPSIGPNGKEYFIRFDSVSLKNTSATPVVPFQAFSAQFTLDSMTGNFSAAVQAQIAGLSTAPLGPTSSGSTNPTSAASSTSASGSKSPSSTSSTSSTAKTTSGAMDLKTGWAGIVFGAVVGVAMF